MGQWPHAAGKLEQKCKICLGWVSEEQTETSELVLQVQTEQALIFLTKELVFLFPTLPIL
jgi:hypothetical protein